ncbi:MAG: hypothetical protein AB7O97_18555 [Planctomycetota bacterium]
MSARAWSLVLRIATPVVPALCVAFAGGTWKLRAAEAEALGQARVTVDSVEDELQSTPEPVRPRPQMRRSLLSARPDVVGTLRELESLAVRAGAGLEDARALPSDAPGSLAFRVQGEATPGALCGLLAAIENSDRLLVVESGRVSARDHGRVDYEFRVATYHRLEEPR